MRPYRTRHFIALIVVLTLNVTFMATTSFAEVFKYRFEGSVDSVPSNWNPCGITVDTQVKGTITFDIDDMTFQPPEQYPKSCLQEATPVAINIAFGRSDHCSIDDTMFVWNKLRVLDFYESSYDVFQSNHGQVLSAMIGRTGSDHPIPTLFR